MKRMVHVVGNLAPGGMGNFLMNIYRNIDREKVQFDFIVMGKRENNFHEEAESLGAHIYQITGLSKNPWKYFWEMEKILKKNKYDIVFRHTDIATVAIDLLAAKIAGVKRRIPHSHSTDAPLSRLHKIMRPFLVAFSTERFACSTGAGEWMYGNHDFQVIHNSIDLEKFMYRQVVRDKIREELSIQDEFVVGHVGNLVYAKNHDFMLNVFAQIMVKQPNSKLLLIGEGGLRPQIEEKIKKLQLQNHVILLGVRQDISDLLQAMDVYLFPSVYEGLPIAVVEAQAAGLPCLLSDVITEDVVLAENVYKKSLHAPAKEWAELILEKREIRASGDLARLKESGYGIGKLVEIYEKL